MLERVSDTLGYGVPVPCIPHFMPEASQQTSLHVPIVMQLIENIIEVVVDVVFTGSHHAIIPVDLSFVRVYHDGWA